jgi:TolA-binding protein
LKTFLLTAALAITLGFSLSAAPADEAIALETRLKETAEASPVGAALMLDLIDLYWKDGQVFGLIRTASKFSRSQIEHPRRAEIMLKLIDGYAASARHNDVITTARQFLEIFPDNPLSNQSREKLATAYELTGRPHLAAARLGDAWRKGAPVETGMQALRMWIEINNAGANKEATTLAGEMVRKLPAGKILNGVAFDGMTAAQRAEMWAEGLQIAKALAAKAATLDEASKRQLKFHEARFESQLGQHENAIVSFRAALSPDNPEAHRNLVHTLIAAKKPIAEIEAEARRYLSAFPDSENPYEPLARAAHAAHEAGNIERAITIGADVIRHDVESHDLPRALVSWCGDNHKHASGILSDAISKNPKGAPKLRAVLALDVYRDRTEDTGKARATAREFLRLSPSEAGWTEEIVKYLHDSAPDNAAFSEDLAAVTASAKAFPHLAGFQDRVWNPAPADKDRNRDWEAAKRDHQRDETTRLWVQTRENGGKSGQACKALLAMKWSEDARHHLLSRLAYVYRHHLGGKSREVSASHYEKLCKEFPKDLDAASRWLEAADHAEPEMRISAAGHLLTLPPASVHPDTWVRLVSTKDPAIIRKAIPWISASSKINHHSLHQSARIGDILHEVGLKDEATAWWRSRMDLIPDNQEAITCALRVASTMEPARARAFLMPRFEADTGFHGAYAAEIANIDFKSEDFTAMETILSASRKRADLSPFQSWGMGESPARGWLDAARNSVEWPDETKTRVQTIIRDLRIGRLSAEAGLALLEEQSRTIDRLLTAQKLIRMAGQHHESWRRLYPFAQAALAREDHSLAAAILNGLINTTRSVGEAEMTDARTLLRKAYGEMGSISNDIPADSPIAPLLQIILHLRLGEGELAEETYYENKELFDAHRHELPLELLLYGAETHISQGTPADHERAEDILRGWLMKFGEAENIDARDKARVQILLARNYQRASQYDIARAEFTTVLNIYKDQPEAIDARFGIGETYLAQKVYDQAGEIFTGLAESPLPNISTRANFLMGVLALRQENNEQARGIFLSVLENAPDAPLANETLFNLAEVYGIEQRFLTQLETLRTVGRLGQESKLWQTPGNALAIVVQDPDLGISRGDTRIPVIVRTEPGNDSEEAFLTSGGAGKGIFLTEIPTMLGEAEPGDGILQVTGGDTIIVDYPEDFKKQFQFEFLSSTRLRIASDGVLQVASSEIIDKEDPSFTEKLQEELVASEEKTPRSATRPPNQVKPGNLIYIRVKDGDRDLTSEPDTVPVRLTASSGDEVRIELTEEGNHGGVFVGTVRTGELPAGASASDSALDHNPLMAIDHDPQSAWRSVPDGTAPKSLSIDMKELRAVENITLTSPDPEKEAPVRMTVHGSHDGRFHYKLAEFPTPEPPAAIDFPEAEMNLRTYRLPAKDLAETYSWEQIAEIAKKLEPDQMSQAEFLSWQAPEEGEDAFFLIWSGAFVQEREGAVRLSVSGKTTAILLNGRLELAPGEGGRSVDVFLERGLHDLTLFTIASPDLKTVEALRARENPQASGISLRPFVAADFDPTAVPDLPKIETSPFPEITRDGNNWHLSTPPRALRHVEFEFLEYLGEAVAVANVEISGADKRHIPPAENLIELAGNDILELAPGDTVQVSYLDELTAGGEQTNRLLTQSLTATFYNGTITPIGYEFIRDRQGSVNGTRKELLRIDPGDRIVAEVVDFDEDIGLDRDTVSVDVQVNAETPVTFTATESEGSSGIFLAEIETSAEPAEGKITVKPGDKLYLRYMDRQNNFPGHAVERETVVFINTPTEGLVRILDSEIPVEGVARILPAGGTRAADHVSKIDYALPLTVEVIDPDQAKDSNSTVTVEVTTTQGTKVFVECVLSRAFASPDETIDETRNPALFEGRFIGQIPLRLGNPDSPTLVPTDGPSSGGGIGKVLPPEAGGADGNALVQTGTRVLNITGADTITASYRDHSRPDGDSVRHQANAALFSAATLRITDQEYREDAEIVHVGKRIYIELIDPDRDISPGRDKALVRVLTSSGEDETIELEETLSHSGIFSGSFPLVATTNPTPGNFDGGIECFFGDEITVGYLDNVPQTPDGLAIIEVRIPVAVGTDGELAAFGKVFKNEELAIQTRFHIAESYFELFKGHRKLENGDEAQLSLQAGRRVLRELREEYPNPEYAARVSYLLGQFAQEMNDWDEAIAAYGYIVRNHPEHNLAPDSQYKLGQCYEEAGELDEALEAYVTLAATYPKSPLVANVMLRINEHFYVKEEFAVAASVGAKFVERFPNHEWAPRMAFRIGQCHYKLEDFRRGGEAFDLFVKRFPEQELTAQALFWAGECYRGARDIPEAFRRYNRCRWDFPESDAAKYSRGRLALPELLAQFEREANLE